MTAERYWRELTVWDEVGYGLDLAPAKAMSLNNIYVRWFEPGDLLDGGGAAAAWDEISFERRNKTTRSGKASWRMSRPATIYGLALWWRAELAPGVMLSTGPLDPRTHWEQLYLPALAPIRVEAGQTFAASLRSTTSFERGTNVTWTLTVADRAAASCCGRRSTSSGGTCRKLRHFRKRVIPASAKRASGKPAADCDGEDLGDPRSALRLAGMTETVTTDHSPSHHSPQSWMRITASISTEICIGSEPMPTAERAWRPRSPSTATNRSEQPLITLG